MLQLRLATLTAHILEKWAWEAGEGEGDDRGIEVSLQDGKRGVERWRVNRGGGGVWGVEGGGVELWCGREGSSSGGGGGGEGEVVWVGIISTAITLIQTFDSQ